MKGNDFQKVSKSIQEIQIDIWIRGDDTFDEPWIIIVHETTINYLKKILKKNRRVLGSTLKFLKFTIWMRQKLHHSFKQLFF